MSMMGGRGEARSEERGESGEWRVESGEWRVEGRGHAARPALWAGILLRGHLGGGGCVDIVRRAGR